MSEMDIKHIKGLEMRLLVVEKGYEHLSNKFQELELINQMLKEHITYLKMRIDGAQWPVFKDESQN